MIHKQKHMRMIELISRKVLRKLGNDCVGCDFKEVIGLGIIMSLSMTA